MFHIRWQFIPKLTTIKFKWFGALPLYTWNDIRLHTSSALTYISFSVCIDTLVTSCPITYINCSACIGTLHTSYPLTYVSCSACIGTLHTSCPLSIHLLCMYWHQACAEMRAGAFKCKCKCNRRIRCKCKCKYTAFESNANAFRSNANVIL